MLTIHTRKVGNSVLIGMLLLGSPAQGLAGSARRPTGANAEETASVSRPSIGAPQVLEIPPAQETAPPPMDGGAPGAAAGTTEHPAEVPSSGDNAARPFGSQDVRDERTPFGTTPQPALAERRTYLGVLYATVEDEASGVKVLDVIPGSPAARAGFEGANAPKPKSSNDIVKIALVALTMSPVGAFAMPLLVAHNMYSANHQSSAGDVIVAIGDRQVRDAVEFSQEMHHYQPGDTVTFSILRQGKPLQVPVVLEEEPS